MELAAAHERYPIGAQVIGTVDHIPRPGLVGLFVDLGRPPVGFVDVLTLPRSAERWPSVGTVTEFEILAHTPDQVRLWPLDERYRSSPADRWHVSENVWRAWKSRYPIGSDVIAGTTEVFVSDHSYVVRFDDAWSVLFWSDDPPVVGGEGRFVVDRHLDATRRILLRPSM